MKVFVCVCLCAVSLAVLVDVASGNNGLRPKKFTMSEKRRENAFRPNADGIPDFLAIDLEVEGHEVIELELHRDLFMSLPKANAWRQDGPNVPVSLEGLNDGIGFYKDANKQAVFACKAKNSNTGKGQVACNMVGIVHFGDEDCYIDDEDADATCALVANTNDDQTEGDENPGHMDQVLIPPVPEGAPERRRRYTPYPEPGYKVVRLAFAFDKAMMAGFYIRHTTNGLVDVTAGQNDAVIFASLLAVEMNVYMDSLKTSSGTELNIYVYPSELTFPTYNTDIDFVSANTDENYKYLFTNGTFWSASKTFINHESTFENDWDHSMIITGLNLYSQNAGVAGVAYGKTACKTSWKQYAYSIVEYLGKNIGRIAAHELGHALGSGHDGVEGCPPNSLYIMSAYYIANIDNKLDTFHMFSDCSSDQIYTHLNSQPDCLGFDLDMDALDFRRAFCAGLLGQQEDSLANQCKRETGYENSVNCNTVDTEAGCYQKNYITCSSAYFDCSTSTSALKFVWNGTPCMSPDQYCYEGKCVTKQEVCAVANCSCCDENGNRNRKACCRENNNECYCCGALTDVKP